MEAQEGQVYLQANPDKSAPLYKGQQGMTLFLINATPSPRPFQASDSCLSIIQEALDTHGQWKPIEFFFASTCGNSYHTVSLGAHEYWSFPVPRYKGAYKTKLRFRLSESASNLLSNEFEGSVNLGQFAPPKESYKWLLPTPY